MVDVAVLERHVVAAVLTLPTVAGVDAPAELVIGVPIHARILPQLARIFYEPANTLQFSILPWQTLDMRHG